MAETDWTRIQVSRSLLDLLRSMKRGQESYDQLLRRLLVPSAN